MLRKEITFLPVEIFFIHLYIRVKQIPVHPVTKDGIVPIFRLSLFSFSYKNCIVFYGAIYAPDRFDHFHQCLETFITHHTP